MGRGGLPAVQASGHMISHRQAVARVRYWRNVLRLGAWGIEVEADPPTDADGAADCAAKPEYLIAQLWFDLKALDKPGELDAAVVHELLHLYCWKTVHAAETMAKGDPVLLEWIRTEEEALVTSLERLVLHLTKEAK